MGTGKGPVGELVKLANMIRAPAWLIAAINEYQVGNFGESVHTFHRFLWVRSRVSCHVYEYLLLAIGGTGGNIPTHGDL